MTTFTGYEGHVHFDQHHPDGTTYGKLARRRFGAARGAVDWAQTWTPRVPHDPTSIERSAVGVRQDHTGRHLATIWPEFQLATREIRETELAKARNRAGHAGPGHVDDLLGPGETWSSVADTEDPTPLDLYDNHGDER